ncbi:deoxyribodipyrimidine photolyase [Pseudoalteromonas luteoviolacea]|uniref:Deoxyribodipyrimidine photo-lyase n=1 Tax=Pseudoalteromonas luteoviolacea TaxID=43657 RepID=A0A1C0TRX1_9GAMM|nr:deoxyribodipyrimidine photo-lyase [Pseudoalteromonas luteoviolacea]OCQ22018.1 deoxyribodipyrimidine photolyase [Pseudoalteromonas luteoviolacea]
MNKTIFWFRRDLRLHGNEALIHAINNGAKEALFFMCEKQWQKHNTSEIQLDMLKRRVAYLGEELAKRGIKLTVLEGEDFKGLPNKLKHFVEQNAIAAIYANREYEINELHRDKACSELGIDLCLYDGDVLSPPGSIVTKGGEMFKVFTPFKKAWLSVNCGRIFPVGCRLEAIGSAIDWVKPEILASNGESDKWPIEDHVIEQVVTQFIYEKVHKYDVQRDIPSIKGTSGLSPYLALGIVSVSELIGRIQSETPDVLIRTKSAEFAYVNELIWREFYRHLMFVFPKLCKGFNFNEKYNAVNWLNQESQFKAWCEGKTGYPIVDAAMRQLNQTGWMHNRLRMIVASFLTKHLLIDWRWGEAYFMSKLIDGDLASNNGGWQWAASTGCDAQPYFRIFNPITQSEKFDPDGTFIRKYVHELESVPAKYIHFPHDYLSAFGETNYSAPIVEHKAARERALAAFKV